jgi:uncharacterized protein YgbK (DUF1537 family)
MEKLLLRDELERYSPDCVNMSIIDKLLNDELKCSDIKIVVLDDDPTGIQTVHGISVYTDWSIESIRSGFSEPSRMFYILTNSRSFTAEETKKVHEEIAINVIKAAKEHNKDFIIISRGDSTLRGHYPLETEILKETLERNYSIKFDGEVIFPFFKEGGRYTINDIHYAAEGEYLVPVGDTEFAKDKTFGFSASHLPKWVEEKSKGIYNSENILSISLESLRKLQIDEITEQLMQVSNFNKVIVNALDYCDVKVFCIALYRVLKRKKKFLFRTAATFVKVVGGVSDKALLSKHEIISANNKNGGLIIAGSHTKKTTEQLEELKSCDYISFIEFNQHLVLNPHMLYDEVNRVVNECENHISKGRTVVVYTRRQRIDLNADNKEEELKISVKISNAVTSIVERLQARPNFIIAKGGITSSDIGVKGLRVKKATALGQIRPGIPVWNTGEESKFPQIPYIIFPGNVGSRTTLKEAVEILCGE